MRCFVVFLCACFLTNSADAVTRIDADRQADETSVKVVAAPSGGNSDSANLCGMYALFAAANACGIPVEEERLFSSRYLAPSQDGSRTRDLLKACEDFEIPAYAVFAAGLDSLVSTGQPVLLLLPKTAGNQANGHWLLLLGREDQEYRVYDSSSGIRQWTEAELMSDWGGTAIVVGTDSDRSVLIATSWFRAVSFMLVPVGLLWLFRSLQSGLFFGHRLNIDSAQVRIGGTLVAIAGWLALSVAFSGSHPLRNLETAQFLKCMSPTDAEIPMVDWSEIPNATLVDCRLSNAYQYAHLPDAISIPISMSAVDFRKQITSIDTSRPCVLYCQSEQCRWAEIMGRRLQCLGIRVYVLRGGIAANVGEIKRT